MVSLLQIFVLLNKIFMEQCLKKTGIALIQNCVLKINIFLFSNNLICINLKQYD